MTIGMYSAQYFHQGGIERVVRELVRIFAERQVKVWLVRELGGSGFDGTAGNDVLPKTRARRDVFWERAIRDKNIDLMVFHYVAPEFLGLVVGDIGKLRSMGVQSCAVCHHSFPSAMLLDGDESMNGHFYEYARQCDMVAPVSEIDTLWWRALGCRAMHVQNPFVHPRFSEKETSTVDLQPRPIELLWVGRNTEQKRPDLAIEVLARVSREVTNVHLTMIGGSDAGWNGVRKLATQLGIGDKVTCLGQRDDLNDLWDKADIHLLTSVTESFCLVLAEAKAKGIPTAMFEIPFLELVESGRGLVTAPQGDVEALAAGIVELVKNPEKRQRLGEEARESLAAFNDEAVWQSWVRVFDALKTGEGGYDVDPAFRTIVTQQHFAWNRFCEKNLWAVQMVRDVAKLTGGVVTMRNVARALHTGVRGIRKLKAVLRGA